MNTLKYLTIVLSVLISFNSFHHIAFADDHGEDEYIYEENEIADELEDGEETDSETDGSDKSDSKLYD